MDARSARPHPHLAFWLSVFVPGLGQIYSGAPLRGALFFALTGLGVFVVADAFAWGYTLPYPESLVYCAIGIALLGGFWPASAIHARHFAERLTEWPLLYRFWPRFFARTDVRQALQVAWVEIGMALLFAVLIAIYLVMPDVSEWFRELPSYWFLYEAFGALYLALAHGIFSALDTEDGRLLGVRLARKRTAGFFVISIIVSGLLNLGWNVPVDGLLIAFLFALPSCWYTVRHRSGDMAREHMERFGICLLLGFASFFVFALVVNLWEFASGQPEYQMRFRRDEAFFSVAMGLIYYPARAALEIWMDRRAEPR